MACELLFYFRELLCIRVTFYVLLWPVVGLDTFLEYLLDKATLSFNWSSIGLYLDGLVCDTDCVRLCRNG